MSNRPLPIIASRRLRPRLAAVAGAAALTLVGLGCSSDDGVGANDSVPPSPPPSTLAPLVSTSTSSTTSTTTSTTSTTSTTTSTTSPPTTTTEPIVTAGGIVLVANASSVPGAAARLAGELTDVGFTTLSPVNAAGSDESLPTSRIYARDLSDPVARSISRLMYDTPVERMPTPVPVQTGSAGDATVVIMLGKDLATKHLTEL